MDIGAKENCNRSAVERSKRRAFWFRNPIRTRAKYWIDIPEKDKGSTLSCILQSVGRPSVRPSVLSMQLRHARHM